jgi:hypothetical protein
MTGRDKKGIWGLNKFDHNGSAADMDELGFEEF